MRGHPDRGVGMTARIGPRVHRAGHFGAAGDLLVEPCRELLAESDAPDFVGVYADGICDFTVDVLDGDGLRRADLESAGGQLGYLVGQMDQALDPVRGGRLIRVLAAFESATAYWLSIRPREYLVGLVPGRPPDEAIDAALARLATELRARYGLGPQNPGGFQPVSAAAHGASETPEVWRAAARDAELAEWCRTTARVEDLHYVAYLDDGAVRASADLFAAPPLGHFFLHDTPQMRRTGYAELAHRLQRTDGRLGRVLRVLSGGALTRTVWDVEAGALYHYRIAPGEALIGATLDQGRVADADHRMAELAGRLGAPPPGPART